MKDRSKKRVLLVKNAKNEGPGNIKEFLRGKNIESVEIEAYKDNWRTHLVDNYDYIVVLGGPMGVYEMDRYPYLKRVAEMIELALKKEKKILGICLGAQLLAHVLGAKVYNSGEEEIGWCEIELTNHGFFDECLSTFFANREKCEVFQWHNDTFDLPRGALRLASSKRFPNQAFLYYRSYGLQFHPEVTPSMIKDWVEERRDFGLIINKTELIYPSYKKAAESLYEIFFK
ncbi:MAG: type 1 glutamine amidotransferase [Deltaproteobacteria bacterium]|nr:type 1 glutamine amidotransferase [Deltaproteobacteria bacterium]